MYLTMLKLKILKIKTQKQYEYNPKNHHIGFVFRIPQNKWFFDRWFDIRIYCHYEVRENPMTSLASNYIGIILTLST